MTTHRSVSFLAGLAGLAGIVAGFLLFTLVPPAVAHAQGAAAAPAPGINWSFWLGLFAAVGTSVSLFLHWLAPRTKTTLDDKFRDDLDEVLAFARNFTGTTKAETPTSKGSGTAAMLAVLLLGGIAVTQTGCAASQRESTIKAAMITVDASKEAYVVYDAHAQTEIVAKATSLDDGKAKLAEYRARREKLVKALTVAYQAIATAAQLNDEPSLAGMQKAIGDVLAILNTLTGSGK